MAALALLPVAVAAGCRGYKPADPPQQPIAFYHDVHAGQNQIPCAYCHYTADRSVDAGIPSVQLCVGCHVPGSSAPTALRGQAQLAFPKVKDNGRDSAWYREGQKLVNYWKNGQGIPWVRIHKIPEHAKFPHNTHVNVGLQCQTCHGPVQEMTEVYQFSSLRMGWCIECHRGEMPLSPQEESAVRARSSFIQRMARLRDEGGDMRGLAATFPNQRASTDCMVCHY
ncbi:MAG TPA: cytochrome c3 family protein [Longimicrobium sp.]